MEKISCTVTLRKDYLVRVAKAYEAKGMRFNTFAGLVGKLLADAAQVSPVVSGDEVKAFKFNSIDVNFFK